MTLPKKLLIIGLVWPEPTSSASGSRMMQLILFFKDHGWQITFASAANVSKHMADLEAYGIRTKAIKINHKSFDQFIKELNPHIVLFDRFMTEEQFGWRVHNNTPEAVRILDMEDLHCLRFAREQALRDGESFSLDYLISDLSKREIASIYRSDLSLVISEFEMDLINSYFKVDPKLQFYLPYLLDQINETEKLSLPEFSDRSDFISIGNFRHKPNLDAVHYLKDEIWPIIRQSLPHVKLKIFGAYPSQKVKQLHDPSTGFIIKGRAKDAKKELRSARVSLAPIRFGAGLKGKLTESMQCGTPCITTSVGAEGINALLEWPGEIADKPLDFAQAAIKYYNDQEIWTMAQHRGVDIINHRFSPAKFTPAFNDQITELQNDLEKHRKQNFIGSMLMHHSMASTRFMSLWIEEKNKDK